MAGIEVIRESTGEYYIGKATNQVQPAGQTSMQVAIVCLFKILGAGLEQSWGLRGLFAAWSCSDGLA